jgi:iron uptake system component EfeO
MATRTARTTSIAGIAATALALTLTGCVANGNGAATFITVTSSATACTVSKSSAPTGTVHFTVTNTADAVTEFYLLGKDKQSVVGEVENVTPGVKRTLTVHADPGTYYTECKPGMADHAVGRAKFTVRQ